MSIPSDTSESTLQPAESAPTSEALDDAPRERVWAHDPLPDGTKATSLEAVVEGVLRYDAANDCFLLDNVESGTIYPVVWPARTVAAEDDVGVTVASGHTFRVGDVVSGAWGYLKVAKEWGIPEECDVGDSGDVAVYNASETLTSG